MQVRLGFLEQGEQVWLETAVGAESEPCQGVEDEHRGETPAAEPVLSERQNRLLRLVKHDLRRSGQFFEARGQRLYLDSSDAGLGVGDSGEVVLERAQDRTGVPDAMGQISERILESFTPFALFGVLLDLEIGENSAPDVRAIAQFFDQVSGCIQEVSFDSFHQLGTKAWGVDACPFAVTVGLKKRPSG